jgi:prepilin-type N-terminal cleavage/methylation domain-containing protein
MSKMKNHLVIMNNLPQGFTLLELLLVLTLLTALTVSGLGMYEIKLRNFKVDKTALQMQQWLQAGLSFYLDCQQWPTDSQVDQNIIPAMMGESAYTQEECPALVNQKRIYMPKGSDKNGPWTYTYSNGTLFENSYDIAPIKNPDGTNSKVFSVSTIIGYQRSLLSSAKMIAGRLPNATTLQITPVLQKPIWVQAYVNAGGSSGGGGNGGYLVNIQNVNSQAVSQIKSTYQCPAGMEYKTYYGLSQIHVGPDSWRGERFGVYASNYSFSTQKDFIVPNLNIDGNCQIGNCSNNGASNQVLLIGACMPIIKKSNLTPISTSGNNSGNNYARY